MLWSLTPLLRGGAKRPNSEKDKTTHMGAVGCVGVGARMRRADSVRCRARAGARAGVTSSSSAHAVRGKREARVVTSQASRRESVRVAAAMTVSPLSGGVSALRGAATVARPARGFGLQIFCKKTKSILKRQRQVRVSLSFMSLVKTASARRSKTEENTLDRSVCSVCVTLCFCS